MTALNSSEAHSTEYFIDLHTRELERGGREFMKTQKGAVRLMVQHFVKGTQIEFAPTFKITNLLKKCMSAKLLT